MKYLGAVRQTLIAETLVAFFVPSRVVGVKHPVAHAALLGPFHCKVTEG